MAKLSVLLLLGACAWGQRAEVVTSFESEEQLQLVVARDTRHEVVGEGVTDGARALRITFGKVQWPALFLRPAAAWDLRGWGELVLDVTNPEDEAVSFSLRVDDDFRANGTLYCRTGAGTLGPGERQTFAFPLEVKVAADYGMRGLPTWAGRGAWARTDRGRWKRGTSCSSRFS